MGFTGGAPACNVARPTRQLPGTNRRPPGDTRQRHHQPADGERDLMLPRFSGDRRIDAVDCVQDLLDYVAIRRMSPTDTKNGRDVDAWWSSLPL